MEDIIFFHRCGYCDSGTTPENLTNHRYWLWVSPWDSAVSQFFLCINISTHHALGLKSNDGLEMLIHVGLETVNLKGKYFTPKKKSGDTMKKGDILLEFDIDKIKADGYDVTTPIIISNTEQFAKVKACEDKVVTKESKLLSVQ